MPKKLYQSSNACSAMSYSMPLIDALSKCVTTDTMHAEFAWKSTKPKTSTFALNVDKKHFTLLFLKNSFPITF